MQLDLLATKTAQQQQPLVAACTQTEKLKLFFIVVVVQLTFKLIEFFIAKHKQTHLNIAHDFGGTLHKIITVTRYIWANFIVCVYIWNWLRYWYRLVVNESGKCARASERVWTVDAMHRWYICTILVEIWLELSSQFELIIMCIRSNKFICTSENWYWIWLDSSSLAHTIFKSMQFYVVVVKVLPIGTLIFI